jgi:hypothetical protein
MSRTAADVPADDAILCEGCGYQLDGLPLHSNCPECGKPIAESTGADGRRPPAWEASPGPAVGRFVRSTALVIVRPSVFFRTSTARGPLEAPRQFAVIHWALAAALFGAAGATHWWWFAHFIVPGEWSPVPAIWLGLSVLTYLSLWGLTRVAASLTTWEARYRGYRLPRNVVLRAMYYHAAHYPPVAAAALATTLANAWLFRQRVLGLDRANAYLSLLSGEIVVLAVYLFWTYWAAMRNMMYANR